MKLMKKKTIKKEKEEEEKVEKPPVTEKKAPITKKAKYKQRLSDNQIVKQDDMYCYVGEDDNMRQCIEVFKDDMYFW